MSGRRVGQALALTAAVAFSFKAIFVRAALGMGADPLVLLSLRMVIAAPFYVALLLYTRGPLPTPREAAVVAAMGLVGFALSAALDFQGLAYIGAGLERIVLYAHPTLVVLLGAAWHRRAPSPRALGAIGVAWTGLVIAAAADLRLGRPEDVLTGVALVLGCALTYAMYLLALGDLAPRLGAVRVTAAAQVVAALALGAWAGLFRAEAIATLPEGVWVQALLLATAGTILPGLLLASAVSRIGPGPASTLGMIGPVAAALLAHLLLGEPLSGLQLVGAAVVVAGVSLATRPEPGDPG